MVSENFKNPLGIDSIGSLLKKLAIPAVIANVVNALYNIVDQIFIGQGIGHLGNAATSIAFPVTTICMALGLMFGVGGASKFNLELGKGDIKSARKAGGTAASSILIIGIILCIFIRIFLSPLLVFFGATDSILSLAKTYTGITSLGIPFLLFATSMNPLVRADGSSRYSMMAVIAGAVLNTILDPIFIFTFNWGMAGAAWATIIGQGVSAIILMVYFKDFKSVKFKKADFRPEFKMIKDVCALGMATFIFQFSNLIVQIITNNSLKYYGGISIYGSDIPIAVAGVIARINVIFVAVIIGVVQGSQPISSFNYGAKLYERVREVIRLSIKIVVVVGILFWALFEAVPTQILSAFGEGNHLYFQFGVLYMRIFFALSFLNGGQIYSSTFFTSIGKAKVGAMISLFKQLMLIAPLLIILPKIIGIIGLAYALPIADGISFVVAAYLLFRQYKSSQTH